MDNTKGIIYYTDNNINKNILRNVQGIINKISIEKRIPVVCSSLDITEFGDKRIIFPELKRGILTMFKQILGALELLESDIVFFCEHDILYHPSHFDFIPPRKDVYYYNTNVWRLWISDKIAIRVNKCMQVSGLCGNRELLLGHYQRRIERLLKNQDDTIKAGKEVKNDGFSKHMGFEPGGHMVPRGVDTYPMVGWESEYPIVDLRHGENFTRGRRHKEDFHDKSNADGWTESKEIPGWGNIEDIMRSIC